MLRKLCVVATATIVMPVSGQAQDIQGCWIGTIAEGTNRRRAVMEVTEANGVWRGQFTTLVDQVATNAMDSVSNRDGQWTFTVPGVGGSPIMTGTVGPDGNTFRGTGNRAGATFPFAFRRVGDTQMPPAGYWQGALYQGGAPAMKINLSIAAAPCGQVLVTMDSPDQGSTGMAVTDFEMRGDSVRFDMSYIGGSFAGTLSDDRAALKGTWRQGGNALPMEMTLGEAPAGPNRPQEPQPPFPYHVEEVAYENAAAGITLAGTLTAPSGGGPHPAVILITGSGAQDRDETIMGHKPFLLLADHLTRLGIAVLRYDDRGVGGSGGNTMLATLQDNATDVEAGLAYLRGRADIDATRIGLLGHSEGGWVAPLVAMTSDVAWVVMLAGPGVDAEQLLYAQQEALLRNAGASQDYIDGNAQISRIVFKLLRETDDVERLQRDLLTQVSTLKGQSSDAERRGIEAVMASIPEAQWETQLRTMATPWFRGLLSYDPTPALRALDVPVLALIGELDLQVPVTQNVPALEAAFATGSASDYTVRALPGLNHLLQTATTGAVTEYGQIEETMAPEALAIIGEWIVARRGNLPR